MHYLELEDDVWVKRWYVIRRPYMYIYASNSETEELGAVNLENVRVYYKRDLCEMLEVSLRFFSFFSGGRRSKAECQCYRLEAFG